MSTVADVITQIRFETDDADGTRWEDATVLKAVIKAIKRADNVVIKNGLEFGKASTTLTVSSGATTTAAPSMRQDIGLFNDGAEVEKLSTHDFETKEGDYWRINGSNIELKEEVDEDTEYTFWYYPLTDYSSYTSVSTMPWDGRLDDFIADYAALVLKNIDEYSIEVDIQLAKDFEQSILDVYKPLTPIVQQRKGWLS